MKNYTKSEASEEAEQHFALFMQHLPGGAWIKDGEGRYIYVNKTAAEKIFQKPIDELLGKTDDEIFPLDAANHFKKNDSLVITTGQSLETVETLMQNGGLRHSVVNKFPIFDQNKTPVFVGGIAIDVTERKRAEEALRKSGECFALFMQHLPGTAWIKDVDGRYAYANEAAERKWQKTLNELLGKTDDEIFPPDTANQFRENDRLVMATGQSLQTVETIPQDDGIHYEVVNKFPIADQNGTPVLVGGIAVDITELKRAEESLRNALLEVKRLKNRLQGENIYLQEEIKTEHNFEEIVGESPSLKKVLRNVERIASTDVTVFIHGETGTGKELIARAVHNLSPRKDRPLIKINCGAISAGLVESELFGHEKGAFTGAFQKRVGRFELADKGTIFLDEVTELPPDTQVKLLRVLQEGEFERVGSSKTIKVNVRVIAATNRDIEKALKNGSFRSDLFYRLNVFPIEVPPLREHMSDIPLLVNFFAAKFARKFGKEFRDISKETMDWLMSYAWPGNIRELQNILERAVVLAQGSTIEISESIPGMSIGSQTPLSDKIGDLDRSHILRVLKDADWKIHGKGGAASILGINPSTLRSRMKKLGIKKPGRVS